MRENLLAAGAAGGAYSAPPYPLAAGEGLAAPSQEPHPHSRPFTSGIQLWLQIRLPKSAYVESWTYFNPPLYIMLYYNS